MSRQLIEPGNVVHGRWATARLDGCSRGVLAGGVTPNPWLTAGSKGPEEALHLPFGVTLLAPAWHDESLWKIAQRFHEDSGLGCGPQGHGVVPVHTRLPSADA